VDEKQSPSTQPPPQPYYEDEIDLVDIFNVLWRQRYFIFLCTVFFVIIAICYVYIKTPLYEISAQITPKIRGYSNTGEPVTKLSSHDIAAWFSEGVYRELFDNDDRELPVFEARVISKTKSVQVFSFTEEPSEGEKNLDHILNKIFKGNVSFFSTYSNIEKIDMKEIIHKKENTIKALSLQQKRISTIDKIKLNSQIENANTEIIQLEKMIDTIKKNKLQVQNTLKISLSQIENVNTNTREIIESREIALKENGDRIALLMYSNITQQNISFANSLQQQILVLEKQINQLVDKENKIIQEISQTKKKIQGLTLDRDESLALRRLEIDLKIKKNQMEIESLKEKLSNLAAIEIVQYPNSSKDPVKPEKTKIILLSFFVSIFLSTILSFLIHFILKNKAQINPTL